MRIDVPVFKQSNELGCGPTALSMILNFYGIKLYEQDILKKVKIIRDKKLKKYGTFMVELALFARKLGCDVHCSSYSLELYRPEMILLRKEKLTRKILNILAKTKNQTHKRILQSTIDLMKAGGKFKLEMPSLNKVREFLNHKIPVMLAVKSVILFEKGRLSSSGHFIVLTGYDQNKFYYNDPWDGKRKEISSEKLFFALSNNVIHSSAYLIAARSPSNLK